MLYSGHSHAGCIPMELTDSLKTLLIETAKSLKGSARRLFMARTVKELGPGGQQRAARELRWGRMTIRKGMRELATGVICIDAFALRGRKRAEAHLPNLLTDMQAIVDSQSQADPQFRSHRLYTRLTAAEVRRQLMAHKGSPDAVLVAVENVSRLQARLLRISCRLGQDRVKLDRTAQTGYPMIIPHDAMRHAHHDRSVAACSIPGVLAPPLQQRADPLPAHLRSLHRPDNTGYASVAPPSLRLLDEHG